MTLFDVAKKNIKGNFKSYLVYFISMLFSVVIYYTFVSLQYSTEIANSIESSQSMQSIFMVASILLILFVTVFILYSNNFFTKKRKKEVGLYSLLGLRRKTIGKMLFYENLIIGVIVLITGIVIGTFLSKLFSMILIRLLGTSVDVGMTFSVNAVLNTTIVFTVIILFTSIQGYRLIYKFKLIDLFKAEQIGEQEPKTSLISAVLAIIIIVIGYWFAYQRFSTSEEILINIGIMVGGIIIGTILLFSSSIIVLLKSIKNNKKSYYKGMNLITTSNLVYRIKGNARTLSVIALLSAMALCAFSVGTGMYYGFEKTSRLASPFSYMYTSQDENFNNKVDSIIRGDKEHPVNSKLTIPVIKSKGKASNTEILSERETKKDENPIKVISIDKYNGIAKALNFSTIDSVDNKEAIAIRPMYTDYEISTYEGETITLDFPQKDITLEFVGLTVERVINWSYPDIMIIVNESTFKEIEKEGVAVEYIGYSVKDQKNTKKTSDTLAAVKTLESNLSTYYSEYRLGIEGAAFNVFILGFLGLVFVMATGSIIYFKQLSEVSSDKNRYEILKKIGVSKKEINNSIFKQNAFIFLLPLIVGIAHYIVIQNLLNRFFSNLVGVNLTIPIIICITVYIVIYACYYALTVNSSTKIVNGKSTPMLRITMIAIVIFIIALMGILIWTKPPIDKETYTGEKIQLNLPKPTGKYEVGTAEMHLVDENRVDPWVKNKKRELMISIWYPADKKGNKKALYMKSGTAKDYDENTITTVGLEPGQIDLANTKTNSWFNIPVAHNDGGWPVIMYSPGGTVPRNFGTVLVEELASRGYIVVTVDHTYETSAVEFPDGTVVTEKLPKMNAKTILKMIDVRVDDMKYILDELSMIQKGNNPGNENKELPKGLDRELNLTKVGIFGHSAGGATSAQTMYEDERFDIGIDMDGTMGHMPNNPLPVATNGLERPFMLMNSGTNSDGDVDSHLTAKDRKLFWENSSEWKLDLAVPNGAHYTFTDYIALFPQLDSKLSISQQVIKGSIGTGDYSQVLDAQRNYVSAFFDFHLKNISQKLLKSTSNIYPEIDIIE